MTIKVVTVDHGEISFDDADGWQTLDGESGDYGNLAIVDDEGGAIAEFAQGAWRFVYDEIDYDGPRVWPSIRDVPDDTVVADNDGDYFVKRSGALRYLPCRGAFLNEEEWDVGVDLDAVDDQLAPFTEVLD